MQRWLATSLGDESRLVPSRIDFNCRQFPALAEENKVLGRREIAISSEFVEPQKMEKLLVVLTPLTLSRLSAFLSSASLACFGRRKSNKNQTVVKLQRRRHVSEPKKRKQLVFLFLLARWRCVRLGERYTNKSTPPPSAQQHQQQRASLLGGGRERWKTRAGRLLLARILSWRKCENTPGAMTTRLHNQRLSANRHRLFENPCQRAPF
jgi:hypothetical protein